MPSLVPTADSIRRSVQRSRRPMREPVSIRHVPKIVSETPSLDRPGRAEEALRRVERDGVDTTGQRSAGRR
jgi:hypothetical protein